MASAGTPRWAIVFGQWLLCGAAGALLCLVVALLCVGVGFPALVLALGVWGLQWGLIGGAAMGGVLRLFGRLSRGVAPNGSLLIAIVICGICAFVALASGVVRSPWHVRPGVPVLPLGPVPYRWILLPIPLAMLGGLGGTLAASVLWRWPPQRRRPAAWRAGAAALLSTAVVYLASPEGSPLFAKTRAFGRRTSCQSNLKQLRLGLNMYAEDWDGKLPACDTANDLPGVDYGRLAAIEADAADVVGSKGALGRGAIWPYVKNAGLFFCPSDPANWDWRGWYRMDRFPSPGISYAWNAELAGRKLSSIPNDEWLLRDREPWHNRGWNLVMRDGQATWQRPSDPPARE
ncbi:MAG: DUF1559 domain-containing protein [Armatimonadetes bacterium]|nr:DUF1559 domain-containing protein [Armatimonadota bacterium]